LVLGSSPSGPTNLRCSGMIGNDRGGTVLSRNPSKNRDAGLELAYNLRSLTIAEDRGQLDISGVTSGVTLDAQFELPRRCAALTPKIGVKTALCSRRLTVPDRNSISRAALPNWPRTSRLVVARLKVDSAFARSIVHLRPDPPLEPAKSTL
jgi:hypothetical protein